MTVLAELDTQTHTSCPNCFASLVVPDGEEVHQTRCPVCENVFDVPYPVAAMAYVDEPGQTARIYY